jgi:uncharacterized protein (TIGR03435 family)
MKTALVFLFIVLFIGAAFAQQPAFEVASIQPSDPNPQNTIMIGMSADQGMVRYTNISLRDCIRGAYLVRNFQVQGPDWLDNTRFDITANVTHIEKTPTEN